MSDGFRTASFDPLPEPNPFAKHPDLPPWLEHKLLRGGERVTWVIGPGINPPWERYVTHPAMLLLAVAFAFFFVALGRAAAGSWAQLPMVSGLAALLLIAGGILVISFSSGYFTRLVVTDTRLIIVQGCEVVRYWKVDDLPLSLIRYVPRAGGEQRRAVDLDALTTLLGSSSDKFTAASKTILNVGKQIEQIRTRDNDRP
jgi:hypothetical protein